MSSTRSHQPCSSKLNSPNVVESMEVIEGAVVDAVIVVVVVVVVAIEGVVAVEDDVEILVGDNVRDVTEGSSVEMEVGVTA